MEECNYDIAFFATSTLIAYEGDDDAFPLIDSHLSSLTLPTCVTVQEVILASIMDWIQLLKFSS